jgi:hypothetical protein
MAQAPKNRDGQWVQMSCMTRMVVPAGWFICLRVPHPYRMIKAKASSETTFCDDRQQHLLWRALHGVMRQNNLEIFSYRATLERGARSRFR